MWGWLGTQGSAAKRVATLGCALYPLRGKDKSPFIVRVPAANQFWAFSSFVLVLLLVIVLDLIEYRVRVRRLTSTCGGTTSNVTL